MIRCCYSNENPLSLDMGSVKVTMIKEIGFVMTKDRTVEKEACKQQGCVYLIGAGPGDPGLFTLRGKQLLQKAEAVVYDALVGQGVVSMIPESAQKIFVGKRSSNHTMPQEQINELLVALAKEGKTVVRLKGGDPFLFGRGGEEMECLAQHGIISEMVPGVTSALSVPAYQGIPVTHRGISPSVHIITAHLRESAEDAIDFRVLAKLKGTLVFLMGVASLPTVCNGLTDGGMDPDTPAALLMRGTSAHQKRIVATLSTLEEEVKKQGAVTPAIIVVGEVCGLQEHFDWYQKMPLAGTKVVLCRPKELIGDSAWRLRELGAEVVELPTIRTVRRANNTPLWKALEEIKQYDWVVFTSPMGVRIFFEELKERKVDVRALGAIRIAAMGNGTKKELEDCGLYADLVPEIFDGAHLGRVLAQTIQEEQSREADSQKSVRILLPRAAAGNQEILEALCDMDVDDIPTYDTVYTGEEDAQFLKRELEQGELDYVLFTSSSGVRGFVHACGEEAEESVLSNVRAICIGAQTAQTADRYGMQTFTAEQATMESMVEKLLLVHGTTTTRDE